MWYAIVVAAVAVAAGLVWWAVRHSDNGHVPADEAPAEGSAMAVALAAWDAQRELERYLRRTSPNPPIGKLLVQVKAFKRRRGAQEGRA